MASLSTEPATSPVDRLSIPAVSRELLLITSPLDLWIVLRRPFRSRRQACWRWRLLASARTYGKDNKTAQFGRESNDTLQVCSRHLANDRAFCAGGRLCRVSRGLRRHLYQSDQRGQ